MNTVFLLLGGNLGNRRRHLAKAAELISKRIGKIEKISSVYETAAWGDCTQPDYLNQAAQVSTPLSPLEVLKAALDIESGMGRKRNKIWESRLIDIDIIFYGQEIFHEKHLKIPHPHLQDRRFVLTPLTEIAPGFIHPVLKLSLQQLLKICPDQLDVKKYSVAMNQVSDTFKVSGT